MAGAKKQLAKAAHVARNRDERLWRHVFNRAEVRRHRERPPVLDAVARTVLADLERDGYATTSLEALTGDPTLLAQLQEAGAGLEAQLAKDLAEGRRPTTTVPKAFLVHLLGKRPAIDPTGLLARAALHPQLKGVVDSYFGLHTRLADLNVWRTLVQDTSASSSQMWHRDIRDDHYIVKAFVYLEDVDEGTGPFCYLPGSHTKGPRRDLLVRTFRDELSWRASDEDMARVVPRAEWVSCTGPAGTVVIADTNGYHKGGLARTAPRLLLHSLYASATARHRVPLRLAEGFDPELWRGEIAFTEPAGTAQPARRPARAR